MFLEHAYLYVWHCMPEEVRLGSKSFNSGIPMLFHWQWYNRRGWAGWDSHVASNTWACWPKGVWAFEGGLVRRGAFSFQLWFLLLGSGSALLSHCIGNTLPSSYPAGCAPCHCSLACRVSRICQQLLLLVCCVCVCLSGMKFVFQALTDWQGKQGCHFCFVLFYEYGNF